MLGLSKLFPRLRRRVILFRLVYICIILVIWLSIVLPTYILYKQEIQDRNFLEPTKIPDARQFINISARLGFIDPLAGQFRLSMDFQPVYYQENRSGLILFNQIQGEQQLALDITIYIAQLKLQFNAGDRLAPVDTAIYFVNGSSRDYPFDKYATSFLVTASERQNETQGIPLQLYMNAAVPGFNLDQFKMSSLDEWNSRIAFFFYIERASTTIGFSLFIMVLSWGLSLIISFLAIQICLRKRPVEPPMLGPPCTLLFALPSLRNVQPGIPEFGTVIDVASYFWNIVLVAISSVVIILCYILRWQVNPPPAAPTSNSTTSSPPSPPDSSSSSSSILSSTTTAVTESVPKIATTTPPSSSSSSSSSLTATSTMTTHPSSSSILLAPLPPLPSNPTTSSPLFSASPMTTPVTPTSPHLEHRSSIASLTSLNAVSGRFMERDTGALRSRLSSFSSTFLPPPLSPPPPLPSSFQTPTTTTITKIHETPSSGMYAEKDMTEAASGGGSHTSTNTNTTHGSNVTRVGLRTASLRERSRSMTQ